MHIFSVSTVIFILLSMVFGTPVGRGFFVPTNLDPQVLAEIPPHCFQIDADMEACYASTQTTGDIESDAQKMRKCICANDNFSMERVTSCTDDPFAWLDVCGEELEKQEADLGLTAFP